MNNMAKFIGASVLALVVSACGGGDDENGSLAVPLKTTIDITTSSLAYAKTAEFSLGGTELADIDSVTAPSCEGVAIRRSSNGAAEAITCTVYATGELRLSLLDKQGAVITERIFVVPQPQVALNTNLGSLLIELNPAAAPLTVRNFLVYVNAGFYNDTLIHRVVAGFVAQGGWLTSTPAVQTGLKDPITLESNNGLLNVRGSIGMARTSDSNSATSQYYFNLVDNPALDFVNSAQPGYAVFGKVVEGIEFMDEIGKVGTGNRYGLANVPLSPVVVLSAIQKQ